MASGYKNLSKIKDAIRNAHAIGGPAFSFPGNGFPEPLLGRPMSAETKAKIQASRYRIRNDARARK